MFLQGCLGVGLDHERRNELIQREGLISLTPHCQQVHLKKIHLLSVPSRQNYTFIGLLGHVQVHLKNENV